MKTTVTKSGSNPANPPTAPARRSRDPRKSQTPAVLFRPRDFVVFEPVGGNRFGAVYSAESEEEAIAFVKGRGLGVIVEVLSVEA